MITVVKTCHISCNIFILELKNISADASACRHQWQITPASLLILPTQTFSLCMWWRWERERASVCVCVCIADRIGLFILCCCSSLIHFSFSDHIPRPHPYTHPRPTSASAFPIEVGCLQHFCSLHCLLTLKQRDLAFFCIAIFTWRRCTSMSCSDKVLRQLIEENYWGADWQLWHFYCC